MRKLLSILLIIMLIISFIQIRNMYALYRDEISGEYSTSLGKWKVSVNGISIINPGDVVTFNIPEKNIWYLNSDFKTTDAQVIVPNTEAYLDILIDTSETQVDVKYEIEVGKIEKYRIYNNSTGLPIGDSNDIDNDDWYSSDYDYNLKYPFTFELLEITDTFGDYSLSTATEDKGLIIGDETEIEYTTKTKVDKDLNLAKGTIPFEASQNLDKVKVRLKVKWLMEDDKISENDKKAFENMYQTMLAGNTETQTVKLQLPIKVNAIQYFGEDL